jgi:hypothetical protein
MLEGITKKMVIPKNLPNQFDIGITQGSYWGGAQVPYWLLKIMTVCFGLVGFDHLLLRSPLTGLLKFISIIPLFGFWYFFDLAQVFGEQEFVEKNGFAIPFLGPQGIGAGIFINKDGSNLAPPDVAKPWTFMMYALATILFTVLPLNKILIGDYFGALWQIIMYSFFFTPLFLLALFWGFYDEYRVFFDTRGLIEKGAARVIPASWILDPYFKRNALGPLPSPPDPTGGIITQIQKYILDTINVFSTSAQRLTAKSAYLARESADATLSVGIAQERLKKAVAEAPALVTEQATVAAASVAPQIALATTEASIKMAQQAPEIAKDYADFGLKLAKNTDVVVNKEIPKVIDFGLKVAKDADTVITKEIPKAISNVTNATEKAVDKVGSVLEKTANSIGNVAEAASKTANAASKSAEALAKTATSAAENAVKSASKSAEALAKTAANAAENASKAAAKSVEAVAEKATDASQKGGSLMNALESMGKATGNFARKKGGELEDLLDQGRQRAINTRNSADRFHDTLIDLEDNVENLLQGTADRTAAIVTSGMGPAVNGIIDTASVVKKYTGGGSTDAPSGSATVLLFCVAMLAFGGYVLYSLRKTTMSSEDSKDDTPPDSRPVRKSRDSKDSQYSDTGGN